MADSMIPPGAGWHRLAGTRLASVYPKDPAIQGREGCSGVVADWSSGAYDSKRNRLVVWGGGHDGYYGNEIYAVDLDTLKPERITDPGTPASKQACDETVEKGTQPSSRHTYDALAYLPNVDDCSSGADRRPVPRGISAIASGPSISCRRSGRLGPPEVFPPFPG